MAVMLFGMMISPIGMLTSHGIINYKSTHHSAIETNERAQLNIYEPELSYSNHINNHFSDHFHEPLEQPPYMRSSLAPVADEWSLPFDFFTITATANTIYRPPILPIK
ncbi:hypothetical protein PROVRETT_07482 [Providencia rettgeri DSM 1131]|nr:hypothetical protein PROVRETT_07482 [Providencia rettgeri DSM 1131]